MKPDADELTEEIWENQLPGRTWVAKRDYDGRPSSDSVVGVGGRLRISTADRIRNQERIREPRLDPFRNGTLVRIDSPQSSDPLTDSADALTREELLEAFQMDFDDFRDYVAELSEVNVRRLVAMSTEAEATVNQANFLKEQIETRFPVTSGDTKTWREMQRSDQS